MSAPSDGAAPRFLLAAGALALLLAGLYALATSVTNNPLEGWGMLLRALAGHVLVLMGVDCAVRALRGAPSRRAVARAAMVLACALTPLSILILLMSRESPSSWSVAALILAAWFATSGVVAWVAARRSR